ncbi:aryl-sulfate sulfotransferase [Haloarculaceae archaeon H-GB2-1]|nr:aryl-sulfate sulfotransferase [Haloarculaceae archaeon H-GB2-1]
MVDLPRRRWLLRASLGLVVLALVVAGGLATASHDRVGIGAGTIEEEPTNRTVISVQGYHFQGRANAKKPARLLAVQPDGDVAWRHDSPRKNAWFYDVDPMADGHLLVTSTVPGDTIVYEYDPASDERVWSQRLDAKDTHDVDLLDDGTLLVGNLRNYNETSGVNEDRAYVYDREADEIVWQWQFHERFDPDVGGSYEGDWTHLNDVDAVGDGRFLLSPRNFDQVLLVDRSSKEIVMRLGRDGQFETLHAQHNPDFLRGTNGTPTLLVADSENDRVVEYTRIDGDWERTWTVTGLNWPRDADRLPNGNTLITDTHNQRVVEVTPRGEVVWEFYAPWAPYDAERRGPATARTDRRCASRTSPAPTRCRAEPESGRPADRRSPTGSSRRPRERSSRTAAGGSRSAGRTSRRGSSPCGFPTGRSRRSSSPERLRSAGASANSACDGDRSGDASGRSARQSRHECASDPTARGAVSRAHTHRGAHEGGLPTKP